MVCERARHQKTTDKKREKGRKEKMRRARNLRTLVKKSEQRSTEFVKSRTCIMKEGCISTFTEKYPSVTYRMDL